MKRALLAIPMAALFLAAAPAKAQFPGEHPDTFHIEFGAQYAWFDTQVILQEFNGAGGGPLVDLEDVSGLPKSHVGPSLYGYWNFAGRSYLDFGFMLFNREKTRTLTQDFVFGDTTYTVGASTTAKFDSNFPYLAYRYNFVKDPSFQLGLSLGVTYATMETELTASAGVVGPGGPIVGTYTKSRKVQAWIPLLGLVAEGKITDDVSAGVRVKGIWAAITPYKGWSILGSAYVNWYLARNFGLGLGYQYTHYEVNRTTSTSYVEFNYEFNGPMAYVILSF